MNARKPYRLTALLAAAIIVGLGAGYFLWGNAAAPSHSPPSTTAHEGHAPAAEVWTCSMHPQIRMPSQGKCPICGMDLIRAASGGDSGGLRQLTIRPEQRALMRVRTVPVEKRFPDARVRLVGKVTYDETRLGYITAWVPGRIDELYVDFTGVTVKKGDHMVKLYSPELYSAQEELLQAKAALTDLQKSEFESLRASARGTIDSAREKLRLWGISKEQIDAIEERGSAEEHVTIHAPSSGLVIHRSAQEGMYVQTGTRIFTIADLSQVWVQLDAYESDLEWLRYGQQVSFETEAYGGRQFRGRISFIDPVLDRHTRTVKVRVNVPNPDGLLKPDMFVHATVSARIAGAGKVMDPSLVGKWISPMHPEIVKDGPGKCDICGMDLVPAHELGYVSVSEAQDEAPLVIPVSAALVTGTRAIVYVELPERQAPTYEGREVVLGPRAGDQYVVLHGLQAGELVVAEGNFKIDSALQLQARPSMMSPAGGQPAGGHNHGGGAETKKMAMPSGQGHTAMLSADARACLQRIERAYADITAAVDAGDVDRVKEQFDRLGETVAGTPMQLFEGESHKMWMELSMRLSNDAFEGRTSADAQAARASLAKLTESVEMMRKHFGTSAEPPSSKPVALPEPARTALTRGWEAYSELHAALAADDLSRAQSAAAKLANTTEGVEATALPAVARDAWQTLTGTVATNARQLAESEDIDGARAAFERVSNGVEAALRGLGSPAMVHVMRCPMAFDGRGARWLQGSDQVQNPYYGAAMSDCGTAIEVLEPREDRRGK